MRGSAIFSVAVLVLLGTRAMADPSSPPNSEMAAQTHATDDQDKVVCRTLEPPTGTRLGARRECRTQKEWNDLMQEHQKSVTDFQSKMLTSAPPGH